MEQEEKNRIIETIKKEHIVPLPKWKTDLKTYIFWAMLAVLVILSSLFFSLALMNFIDIGPALAYHFKIFRFMRILILTAPFLWIGLSFLTLALGIMIFRKTRRGYRYSVIFVMSIILLAVSFLGVSAHFSRVNEKMERGIRRGMPGIGKLAPPREMMWHLPEEGLVAGEIKELEEGFFKLSDFHQSEWEVFYDDKTEIKGRVRLEAGENVGIIGEKMEGNYFQAEIIRPLGPPPEGFVKGMQKQKRFRE